MIHKWKLHIPPTNYHLLATQQEPYKKVQFLTKKMFENFLRKSREKGPLEEKWQDRKSKRTRQKTIEEIKKRNQTTALRFQTGGKTSDIPGLP